MIDFKRFLKRKTDREDEDRELLEEISKAKLEWQVAQHRLDVVVGHEQVDYAIYALEAAQKRYEMLIRQAKARNVTSQPYNIDNLASKAKGEN